MMHYGSLKRLTSERWIIRAAYSNISSAPENNKLLPLPHKNVVDMSYDLHLPEKSVIKKLPFHCNEPIIFCHGFLGSKRNYRRDCKTLANDLQTAVYCVDLRNHGTTEHAAPFNYDTLVNDVVSFADKHNLKETSIIGYSLGAKIAMLACLKHPEKFSSACIIDNAPETQPHLTALISSFIKPCIKVLEQAKIRTDDKMWRFKASEELKRYIPDPGVRGYLLNNIVHNPKAVKYKSPVIDYENGMINFLNPLKQMVEEGFVKDVVDWPEESVQGKTFSNPVCFVRGVKSPFISRKSMDRINMHFPYSDIVNMNATHFILNERPQEYVQVISNFFKATKFDLKKKRQETLSL